jgi:hypothetical protein
MLTEITLHSLNDEFVLINPTTKQTLSINRKNGANISSSSKSDVSKSEGIKIYGLLGSIQLHSRYLAVIRQVESVGVLYQNHEVFRVMKVDWLPYDDESVKNHEDDEQYLFLFKSVVDNKRFYFSNTIDLTRSVKHSLKETTSDPHFFWNSYLLKDFVNAGVNAWILPVIRGFVSVQNVYLKNGKSLKFSLVSRLGVKRVGTRYFTRGTDKEGNPANYAETEQIIETDKELLSFVQIRGSIPLQWKQRPNLKYTPKFDLVDSKSSYQTHIEEQLARYKKLFLLNLVKATGRENSLAEAYKNAHKEHGHKDTQYIHFDFAARFKFTAIQKSILELTKEVEKAIEDFGYHIFDYTNKSVKREQNGAFRVNCIDCLDRTNVTESVVALNVLERQLRELGYFAQNESLKDYPEFESIFKNTWADNGDVLSNLYAGTGALKADITRTGKRTFVGLYNDGSNSIIRYYLNNFRDGTKRDAIYLFLGKYVVDPKAQSPLRKNAVEDFFLAIPIICWLYLIIALIITYVLHLILRRSGRTLVNNPVLKKIKKSTEKASENAKKKLLK